MNTVDLNWSSQRELDTDRKNEVTPTVRGFGYPGMIQIKSDMDGNCFFHSILMAFYKPYQLEQENGVPITRKDIAERFRKDLGKRLGETIDPSDPTTPLVYDTLSRGTL